MEHAGAKPEYPVPGRTVDQDAHVQGDGRHLADPQFPDDDGAADPLVQRLLASVAAGDVPALSAARALRDWRLLATVVAVLDAVDDSGADKDSHMAVVSVINEAGAKAMLAFSGTDSLQGWNSEGRPVPALGRDLARAALDDGAAALMLDIAGPHRVVLEGPALGALADLLDLDRVAALVQAALAPLTADGWVEVSVVDARTEDVGVDVLVVVRGVQGGHPDGRLVEDLARQAASTLMSRADIQRMVPGGLGVTIGS